MHLSHRKVKAADCPDCETAEGEVEEMHREIVLEGDLDDATRQKLLEIANKCPVHRTLTGDIKVRSRLAETRPLVPEMHDASRAGDHAVPRAMPTKLDIPGRISVIMKSDFALGPPERGLGK